MGVANALNEITLVLFTTLAPSGIVACLIMCGMLLPDRLPEGCRAALNKYLAVPIVVTLVGLVASATHLGNPGNALYVLTGVGRSPLSNEVFAGVVFLGLAGGYWLYSFSITRRVLLERMWIVLIMVSGACFLAAIALAYHVDTIVTWVNATVPVNLVLNGLVGGPLLALVSFSASDRSGQGGSADRLNLRVMRLCVLASAIALAANVAGYAVQGFTTLQLANSTVSAGELAGHYPLMVVLFAVLCAAGILVDASALKAAGSRGLPVSQAVLASALALAGIFVMRFAFYMLHMTVGISF